MPSSSAQSCRLVQLTDDEDDDGGGEYTACNDDDEYVMIFVLKTGLCIRALFAFLKCPV